MKRVFLVLASALAVATHADAATTPSVYVATMPGHLMVVEMFQKPDGQVVGEVETVKLGFAGLIEDEAYPVEGTITGDRVALKPKIDGFGNAAYSGTLDAQSLHIGAQDAPLTLVRMDLASLARARDDLSAAAETADAAWVATQPAPDTDKLTRAATSLDTVLPTMLTGMKSGADMMVEGLQTAQGLRGQYIASLKQKLAAAAPGDRAGVEDDIRLMDTGLYTGEGDLIMSEGSSAQAYMLAHSLVIYFRVACADAVKANRPTPPQCGKVADYETSIRTAQAETRAKFAIVEQIFEGG